MHEKRELMGVSHLLEHMVFKGTGRRTAHQIALSLESLGGSLDAYTSREHTVFQARVLDEHLTHAADVIADIVFRPDVATIGILQERAVRRGEILAQQLQTALDSRVVIEQAKGVLAERLQIGLDDAFVRLRAYARSANVHIAAAARALVEGDLDERAVLGG
jgi:predicted Zn-dependent peptidase